MANSFPFSLALFPFLFFREEERVVLEGFLFRARACRFELYALSPVTFLRAILTILFARAYFFSGEFEVNFRRVFYRAYVAIVVFINKVAIAKNSYCAEFN